MLVYQSERLAMYSLAEDSASRKSRVSSSGERLAGSRVGAWGRFRSSGG